MQLKQLLSALCHNDCSGKGSSQSRGRANGSEYGDGGADDQGEKPERLVTVSTAGRCSVVPLELGGEFLPEQIALVGVIDRTR
jgi:hypothetical protein